MCAAISPPVLGIDARAVRAYRATMRLGAAVGAALAGLLEVVTPRLAVAKSAYFEIRNRCPCAGPTVRTFWTSREERMACVDAVLGELQALSLIHI